MGGSLSSQHCIVASHLYVHTWGGSHSGVAKWDLRTQGGQVSRVSITGLNADTASASRGGGRNRFALASVQYHYNTCTYIGYNTYMDIDYTI